MRGAGLQPRLSKNPVQMQPLRAAASLLRHQHVLNSTAGMRSKLRGCSIPGRLVGGGRHMDEHKK